MPIRKPHFPAVMCVVVTPVCSAQVACDMGFTGNEGDERMQLVSFHSTSKVQKCMCDLTQILCASKTAGVSWCPSSGT